MCTSGKDVLIQHVGNILYLTLEAKQVLQVKLGLTSPPVSSKPAAPCQVPGPIGGI